MTDATAAFYNVPFFDGRVLPLRNYRRVVNSVMIGLGTVAAVCVLVTTVTVAAAWIINIALATNPYIRVHAPIGSGTRATAKYGPTLASAGDLAGSARVSTAPANAPNVTFEARWTRAMASAPTRAEPLVSQRPLERANNVSSPPPHPLDVPQSQAKPEIAHAPDLTHTANLTPPAAPVSPRPSTLPLPPKLNAEWANSVPLPRPNPAKHEIVRSPVGQTAPAVAAATPPSTSTSVKRVIPQEVHKSMSPPEPDSRTAVYDISARTVYLPNGKNLEAHSGLGDKLDDPQYVHVRMRGPTPPNVYDLTLREKLFHGVRAIRLNPVEDDKMFGRDGMLAHSYMLGSNGQSNGCVSFKDYPKFLQAFLSGEVDRLVVVPNLGAEPSRIARARRAAML
jgi:hypothetical protein